jgi:hypothetical protein
MLTLAKKVFSIKNYPMQILRWGRPVLPVIILIFEN